VPARAWRRYRDEQGHLNRLVEEAASGEDSLSGRIQEMEQQKAAYDASSAKLSIAKSSLVSVQARLSECSREIETVQANTAVVKRESQQVVQKIDDTERECERASATL
jgi:chromosome segregation ATPase